MATDANNKIFPLAFAVVDDEMGASWGWFLSCLRKAIQHVVPDSGIFIIFDWHRAIISSIEQWPHDYVLVYHRYCIRHVASNFNTQFKDTFLKSLALKAGYATQARKLDKILDCLKEAELKFSKDPSTEKKKPYSYLRKEDLETWTLSHDCGRRYGAMTTNMSKCFNGVLKGARGLPISALVDYICANLSPISMIGALKYWVILHMVKSSAVMPWRSMKQITRKAKDIMWGHFTSRTVYFKFAQSTIHKALKGETIVIK